jgi:5-methylcytosine-specific restriction protein B
MIIPLPPNIEKEHLLQAIDKIDAEGIPQTGESKYYDVIYNGKNYPPKLIVSIANLFANGEILDRNSFNGGPDTPCFKLLEANDFEIVSKELTPKEFSSYIKQFDQEELFNYFKWLKYFLSQLKISFGDKRLTYNYYDRSLILTIGQRYGFLYKPFSTEAKYFLMSNSSIGNLGKDSKFDGEPVCHFSRLDDLNLSEFQVAEVLLAMNVELSRTEKSRYRKFNKSNFERYILEVFNENSNVVTPPVVSNFLKDAGKQNLIFSSLLMKRYIASLATKPFVIFTGLSGSGKTKLAQTFAKWICESDEQYKIVPVGADWTNREPLLGYPNSLDSSKFVLPDNGALDLILAAIENANGKNLKDCKPYFLILDEMNLSHVERYFADFLSAMESKEAVSLYSGNARYDENQRPIPNSIKLPPNLFLVGTVNIDETTYMFSPKVLDRANTIEFRVDKNDIIQFFESQLIFSSNSLNGLGSSFCEEFMSFVSSDIPGNQEFEMQLLDFFKVLQPIGAEFGYRTANEMNRLIAKIKAIGLDRNEHPIDIAVMQKLLPKLHGSRTKLNKVLPILASLCFKSCSQENSKTLLDEIKTEGKLISGNPILPISFAKIARMYISAQENGFASFAEG